jgi:uncharacterized integral membrane protein (TIGR00698 family)
MIISPQWALLTGIVLSFFTIQSEQLQLQAKLWSARLLKLSVVLLGASLNFKVVLKQGASGVIITLISILLVFALGLLFQRLLKLEIGLSRLITFGTAICGGSAIGALAPIIKADALSITISIGVVFLLNAVSVFLFPWLGEIFSLTQQQFGWWSALAIHDTSSVVAAASLYGQPALAVATTVKLTRALWIIPITLFYSFYMNKGQPKQIVFPWFVLGFLLMSLFFTFIELPPQMKELLVQTSKTGFALTLFLIGLGFNLRKISQVGARPIVFGTGLWIIISSISLLMIKVYF